jgi:hypothetical protein
MTTLTKAILQCERDSRDAIDRLRELAPDKDWEEVGTLVHELRTAVALVGCLRRLAEPRTPDEIHRAFGAPGDFGYETPIGEALARVYGLVGSPSESDPK